ncbi:MAG: SDR family NAD(P)-dependent oxidoreductase [candidate division WOR-3 bacterium]
MKIEGKGVIITGATSGIGYSLVRKLYERNAKILAVGKNEEALKKLKEEFPEIKTFRLDLRDASARKGLIPSAYEILDGVDILINNAGVGYFGSLLHSNWKDLQTIMEVNFWAPLDLSIEFAKFKNGEKAIIVNVISLIAFLPLPKWNIYATSKSAERFIFMSLREELKDKGIKIINVYPPAVKTPFFEKTIGERSKPVGRAVSPDKVADKIVKSIIREKEEVFISFGDFLASKILSSFSPTIVKIYGFR